MVAGAHGQGNDVLTGVRFERVFAGIPFDDPVFITHPGDGSDWLFIVEQRGVIVAVSESTPGEAATFLDISDRVNRGGSEEGLLGLAFDPAFAENGRFFVYYSAAGPRRSVLSRFERLGDGANPDSELVILEIEQPYRNHNGGMIAFGPDGHLYVALGDGGSADDPQGNGQDPSTLLGSVLRIDVRNASEAQLYVAPPDNPFASDGRGRPEVWAYGLRNPWRFSFDRETGELWAGDVGQNQFEEIDVVRAGANYGWNTMEGAHCFERSVCDQSGLTLPVAEYSHAQGCSVTGGYVYRGSAVPSLAGWYVYGDFCTGRIWAVPADGQQGLEGVEIADSGFSVSSFGEDANGELYVIDYGGSVYRATGVADATATAEPPRPSPLPTASPASPQDPTRGATPTPARPTPTAAPSSTPATGGRYAYAPLAASDEGTGRTAWGLLALAVVVAIGVALVAFRRGRGRSAGR